MRDPKYDVLFEPVRIGPLTAKNRFFQVPHCNGMGYRDPVACAEMRAVKAQGGWAVVCTEEAEIHYTSEVTPYVEARIWDDSDIPALARMTDEVVLVERSRTLGGRVAAEARLPGLAEWIRVVDYRLGQISRLDNVERYLESDMTAEEALSDGFDHVKSHELSPCVRSPASSLHGELGKGDERAGRWPERFRRRDPADRPAGSAQRGDGCVVVGLGGDLGDQLGMQHGAV